MKRCVTYIILLMISVVSCRKEPVIKNDMAEISFAAPDVAMTKSILITDIKDMKSGTDELAFSVFEARYIPDTEGGVTNHEQFMNDVKVTSGDNGQTWSYDGTYHWSPGAVHKFFAVYPYYDETSDTYDLGLSFGINEEKHALQMTGKHDYTRIINGTAVTTKVICTGTQVEHGVYGKPDKAVNLCTDILYGVEKYDTPYEVGEEREAIKFEMNHALAAVSFRLRNASEYKITGIVADPIAGFKNAAEYLLLSDDGPVWSTPLIDLDDPDHGHKFEVPGVSEIAAGAYYEPDGSTYWYTALMIPQNFGAYQMSPNFSFKVSMGELGSKTYTLNFKDYPVNNVAEHGFAFLPGYHYIYNLNVTSRVVSCDVEVVPWIEDEPIKLN